METRLPAACGNSLQQDAPTAPVGSAVVPADLPVGGAIRDPDGGVVVVFGLARFG
jgi:hypothetical protein